jgi:ferredoxin
VLVDDRGLFACGSAVRARPHVVQAMADGASAAQRALAFVTSAPAQQLRFDSHLGRVDEAELAEFMMEAEPISRVSPDAQARGLTPDEAAREGARCLRCDCRKRDGCRLRVAADNTHAAQGAFRGDQRPPFERIVQHADVIYEPGKCIRCGLCVQLTAQNKEELGLTFIGRGFDVRIGVPFGESVADALRSTAARCVEACPTAALAFRAANT